MENEIASLKKTARLAGLLYLIWIITAIYDLMYVQPQTIVTDDAVAAQEMQRRKSTCPTRRAASWQHMRRTRGVIAKGNGRVMSDKDCAGVRNFFDERFGVVDRNVQMLGRDLVG